MKVAIVFFYHKFEDTQKADINETSVHLNSKTNNDNIQLNA